MKTSDRAGWFLVGLLTVTVIILAVPSANLAVTELGKYLKGRKK